jgi:hypothetical protein
VTVSLDNTPRELILYIALTFVLLLRYGLFISCDRFAASGSKNRRIDDIHSHLRGTKRDDEIESFQSTECSSTRETKSTMRNPDRLISRKAEFDYGNEFRHNSTQRRGKPAYGLTNQMKKQGMLTNCDDSDQWISTSNHPSAFFNLCLIEVQYEVITL